MKKVENMKSRIPQIHSTNIDINKYHSEALCASNW